MIRAFFLFTIATIANCKVISLTDSNWKSVVMDSNKNVFIKFFAPWCGHCKRLAPDWDKLGEEFTDDDGITIAEVDCTQEKKLCEDHGINGYPALKSFWKSQSEEYSGGRTYDDLKTYALAMKPKCSIDAIENCSKEEKVLIEGYKKMTTEELRKSVKDYTQTLEDSKNTLEELLNKLRNQYEEKVKTVEDEEKDLNPKISLMNEVLNENKNSKEEL